MAIDTIGGGRLNLKILEKNSEKTKRQRTGTSGGWLSGTAHAEKLSERKAAREEGTAMRTTPSAINQMVYRASAARRRAFTTPNLGLRQFQAMVGGMKMRTRVTAK